MRRFFQKYSTQKTRSPKIYTETTDTRKKIEELIEKYKMSEGTALQIATNLLSLEVWEEERRKQEDWQKKIEALESKIAECSNKDFLGLDTATKIIKYAFSLKEYRNQKISKMERQSNAEEFAMKEKIPIHIAANILANKFTLEEYNARQMEKQARQNKAQKIHAEYPNIAMGTCYAILDEGITIEEFLARRQHNQERRKTWYRKYLQEHQVDNQPLAEYMQRLRNRRIVCFFCMFQTQNLVGTIIGHTPYEIKIRDTENKVVVCRKSEIKYFCRIGYAEKVMSLLQSNREKEQKNIDTKTSDKSRSSHYIISPEILKEGNLIEVVTNENDIFIGTIQWASKYDIKLHFLEPTKISVLIFRHAIASVKQMEESLLLPPPTT